MAAFQEKDFFVYPLLSPMYRLVSDGPVELKKPMRALISPTVCVCNNFLYACGGVYDRSTATISSARCFRYSTLNIFYRGKVAVLYSTYYTNVVPV